MEAISTTPDMIQTPANGVATTQVRWQESAMIRAVAVGVVFSVAFSSSFVLGFYLLGPWLDAARSIL